VKVDAAIEGKLSVERSRFHALLFPAASQDELESVLRERRALHRKARHHCWAWRGRDVAGRVVEQSRDDGEVGHPGRVLLELLRHHDLEGGIVVSRVFGGVKLGVGGVSRAFREAGEAVIHELEGH
jgi:putative IMPACT (imprinted ancient) family translation regulator